VRCLLDAAQARPDWRALAPLVGRFVRDGGSGAPAGRPRLCATHRVPERVRPPAAPQAAARHARDHRPGRAVRPAAAQGRGRALAARAGQRDAAAPARAAVQPRAGGRPVRGGPGLWQQSLLDALVFCVGQISATGLRLRNPGAHVGRKQIGAHLSPAARGDMEALRRCGAGPRRRTAPRRWLPPRSCARSWTPAATRPIRSTPTWRTRRLGGHRVPAAPVARARAARQVSCWTACSRPSPSAPPPRCWPTWPRWGIDNRSLRALIASSSHLTAAKVAERSAESGEHYITRDAAEYRQMLGKAAGGGALIGLTTWVKFALYGLGLSAVLERLCGRPELRLLLRADPAAALDGGHQAARRDRPGHGGQARDIRSRARCGALSTRWPTCCARRSRPSWATSAW
jgi:hypothetical protein